MIKIPYKYIIETKNTKLIELCLLHLFNNYFYETENIIYKNHYITLTSFIPLPTEFLSEKFIDVKIENEFIYLTGNQKNKNRIIITDRILPFYSENPIPFSFPIKIKNNYEIINSNIFYYEITIGEQIKQSWIDEAVVIGYGSIYALRNSNPGWKNNTFGYHLDDGTYQFNGNVIKNFGPVGKIGDVIGAGIIYLSETTYQPFFTINGKLLDKLIPEINIPQKIAPMIGFDHSHKIKYNLGKDEFKFKIKDYLHGRQIISLKNIFFEKKNQNKTFNLSKLKLNDKQEVTSQTNNLTFLNSIISELTMQSPIITSITIEPGNEPLNNLLFQPLNNNIQQPQITFQDIGPQSFFNDPLILSNPQNNFF